MPAPDMASNDLTGFLTGIAADHPLVVIVGIVLLLLLLVRAAARMRPTPKDPVRMFSANQRAEGFARAGGRCELERRPFIRCRGKAHHGDHHFPWSKGGATSMGNFTAACVKCNLSKGAKIASAFSTFRMESRRRRYFPQGLSVKAGEKFAQR